MIVAIINRTCTSAGQNIYYKSEVSMTTPVSHYSQHRNTQTLPASHNSAKTFCPPFPASFKHFLTQSLPYTMLRQQLSTLTYLLVSFKLRPIIRQKAIINLSGATFISLWRHATPRLASDFQFRSLRIFFVLYTEDIVKL